MKESIFKFSDPKIIYFNIEHNVDFDKEMYEGFSISSNIETAIIKENQEAVISLILEIGEKNHKYPFYLRMKISANFKTQRPTENFESLMNVNAPALLLSYSRPIVSLMSSQAGFPALNLPFMNFTND